MDHMEPENRGQDLKWECLFEASFAGDGEVLGQVDVVAMVSHFRGVVRS